MSTTDEAPKRPRKKVKLWHILFLAVLVVATLLLAWWQWTRFQSGSGTFQNLGYALQWPLFGIFFIYAYRMILRYENERLEAEENSDDPNFLYEADAKQFAEQVTEIDEDFLPTRPEINVEEFNELNVQRRGRFDDYEGRRN